ncbi:hypothetical protein K2W90_01610 [Candidatus Babeliales bacterium]|nr:hypothetical protein [Candidatus Babeliales bacterium]
MQNTKLEQECIDLFNAQGMSTQTIRAFQEVIYNYYHQAGRTFAWRQEVTPYRVVVSEIMLQQTQTYRVAPKFDAFVERFPTFNELAHAPFEEVLRLWKGLGYNRRALNLQKIAHNLVTNFDGQLPNCPQTLATLPGIGKATAASICAFAHNTPTTFIETNIRTVFIYFFYRTKIDISDKELMPLIEKTVDTSNPRHWYYALMDYGVMLKKNVGNLCKLSKHYAKQSKFQGSDRQIRGMILQVLLEHPLLSEHKLIQKIDRPQGRIQLILDQLCQEGFIQKSSLGLKLS